jgi:hypothetical protein
VKEVSKILHGRIEEQHLTTARVRELHQLVEPFIYGATPMFTALNEAEALFRCIDERDEKCKKLLFILSDGRPTDGLFFGIFNSWNLAIIKPKLEKENVVIVSCFISKSSNVEPRKLHSVPEDKWEEGAKFMFNLSSVIPTSSITRAVFMKNKWQIDITNNETKLFMHVNHPDNLRDACNLARNAVCFQDSLSELLVSVSLDIYINDKNHSVKVYDQDGENTCYAHASATVVHLAMHRILGRDDGHPSFEALRDEMINKYGKDGTNTLNALEEICPQYRLQCKKVDVHGAMGAITEKCPVVAIFGLTENEWQTFYDFFERTRNGILTKRDLHKMRRSESDIGHAVVLTSFNSKCLDFMNSWGDGWADNGFFKVKNADVLKMEFIDIFWNESDLTDSEKASYRKRGAKVADTLRTSLKALQVASFICPECKRESNVDEFLGTLTRVKCPKCRREFSSSDGKGNLLALNIYLTKLSG